MCCYVVSDLSPEQCERGTIFAVMQRDFNGPANCWSGNKHHTVLTLAK